nr:hypothetical protein [Arsenophonus nasoniae]
MDSKHSVWRKLFSKKGCRRNLARAVIRLLRHSYDLINPSSRSWPYP